MIDCCEMYQCNFSFTGIVPIKVKRTWKCFTISCILHSWKENPDDFSAVNANEHHPLTVYFCNSFLPVPHFFQMTSISPPPWPFKFIFYPSVHIFEFKALKCCFVYKIIICYIVSHNYVALFLSSALHLSNKFHKPHAIKIDNALLFYKQWVT